MAVTPILIRIGDVEVRGELADGPVALAVAERLPIAGPLERWGGELAVTVELSLELEEGARNEVRAGEIAYWPPGKSLSLFVGPTPLTPMEQPAGAEVIIASSAVTPVGQFEDVSRLAQSTASAVTIELLASR